MDEARHHELLEPVPKVVLVRQALEVAARRVHVRDDAEHLHQHVVVVTAHAHREHLVDVLAELLAVGQVVGGDVPHELQQAVVLRVDGAPHERAQLAVRGELLRVARREAEVDRQRHRRPVRVRVRLVREHPHDERDALRMPELEPGLLLGRELVEHREGELGGSGRAVGPRATVALECLCDLRGEVHHHHLGAELRVEGEVEQQPQHGDEQLLAVVRHEHRELADDVVLPVDILG